MRRGGGEEEGRGDPMESSPTKAEYLSSGGVLFTYFQGTIGAEVDEHFSRALREGGATPSAQQCGSSSPAHPFSPGSSLCLSSLQPELFPSCKIQAPEPALSGSITHEAQVPGTTPRALRAAQYTNMCTRCTPTCTATMCTLTRAPAISSAPPRESTFLQGLADIYESSWTRTRLTYEQTALTRCEILDAFSFTFC
ncbi:hypothetical protein GJAV_G00212740 [Gymnothorax javanicus]|nr:hypothetical protein GJAV_G00212740 [Gymnothorax javanicus]